MTKQEILNKIETGEWQVSPNGLTATYVIEIDGADYENHILANKEQAIQLMVDAGLITQQDVDRGYIECTESRYEQRIGDTIDTDYNYDLDRCFTQNEFFFDQYKIKELAAHIEFSKLKNK